MRGLLYFVANMYCNLIVQEVLVAAIGKHILRIDTMKVGKSEVFSADAPSPLQCSIDRLIDGIQLVGKHDGEVTDVSMCQWMITRLVSTSTDGTVCTFTYHFAILICRYLYGLHVLHFDNAMELRACFLVV